MRSVIQPGAIVVPAAATVYCVGVEAMSSKVDGYDFSPVNKYRWVIDEMQIQHMARIHHGEIYCQHCVADMTLCRWDKIYSTVDMSRIGHKVLTKPKKVWAVLLVPASFASWLQPKGGLNILAVLINSKCAFHQGSLISLFDAVGIRISF